MMQVDALIEELSDLAMLPILTVRSVEATLEQIARLYEHGIHAVEIVFRTADAAEALRQAKARFSGCRFGAGTMLSERNIADAVAAGADFLISPGLTPQLAEAAARYELPHIPGVQTASEVMLAAERGYRLMKYYPAQASNGLIVLADYANVFPDIAFIPTGKIDASTLPHYLALRNVVAAGGSWMLTEASLGADGDLRDQLAALRSARKADR